ncbi:acetyltransferase [Empedobacter falsenii]
MKDIYIIGASGFAKEVYSLITVEKLFKVIGFIDIKPKNESIVINNNNIPIIDEEYFLENYPKDSNVVIGIGDPKIISFIFSLYKDYSFPNIISDKANLGLDIKIGKGNIVTQNVIMTTNIEIGDGNIFNLSTTIGHDTLIGSYNVFNPSVNISGGIKINDSNLFGVGSIVLQYLEIGSNNIIGGASLVTKSVENEKLIIGVPGKEK